MNGSTVDMIVISSAFRKDESFYPSHFYFLLTFEDNPGKIVSNSLPPPEKYPLVSI